jgi:5'-nucleotidase
MAISLDVGIDPKSYEWDAAAKVTRRLLPTLLESAPGTVLNLNVPNLRMPAELREAHLAPFGIVQTSMKQEDAQHVSLAVEDLPNEPEPGSDAALLAEGFATVTNIMPVSDIPLEVALSR